MKKIFTLFFILILLSWSFFAGIYFWRNYNSSIPLNIKDITNNTNIDNNLNTKNKEEIINRRVIIDLHNIDDPKVIWLPSQYKVFFKR